MVTEYDTETTDGCVGGLYWNCVRKNVGISLDLNLNGHHNDGHSSANMDVKITWMGAKRS